MKGFISLYEDHCCELSSKNSTLGSTISHVLVEKYIIIGDAFD